MSQIFVDAGFIIGLKCIHDNHHDESVQIFDGLKDARIISGINDFIITNLVMIEAHKRIQKEGTFDLACETWREYCLNSTIIWVKPSDVEKAIVQYQKFYLNHATGQPPIGLVDAVSLIHMDTRKIKRIISFDDGFNRIPLVRVIDSFDSVLRFKDDLGL